MAFSEQVQQLCAGMSAAPPVDTGDADQRTGVGVGFARVQPHGREDQP
jgi:hypothetical protein